MWKDWLGSKKNSASLRRTTIDSPNKRRTPVAAYLIYGWCNKNHLLYRSLIIIGILILAHAVVIIYYGHAGSCSMSNVLLFLQASGGAVVTYFMLGAFLLCLILFQTKDSEEYCTVDNVLGGLVYFAYAVALSEFVVLIVGTALVLARMEEWTDSEEEAAAAGEEGRSEAYCDATVFLLAATMLIAKWILVGGAVLRVFYLAFRKCMRPVTEGS